MTNIPRQVLKQIVLSCCKDFGANNARLVLFGSRARNDNDSLSDYDIMIITQQQMERSVKLHLAKKVRSELALKLAGADVLIFSEDEFAYYKDKTGSIVKNAVQEGVVL